MTPGKWNADEDDTLICAHVRQETHDVKSFLFRTQSPRLFRFRPGQFITLELEIDGAVINRCYTISSPPTRPDTLSITVKRHPGGKVSNWLHDNMKPGVEDKGARPRGRLQLHAAREPKVSVPVGWLRRDAADVHGAHALRTGRGSRRGLRAQRTFAARYHLSPRTGDDGARHEQLPHGVRVRANRRSPRLERADRLSHVAALEVDRAGSG